MAAIIKIKRSTGTSAPSSLKTGELAYAGGTGTQSNGGDRLYFGQGDDGSGNATEIVVIGGEYFTNLLDHAPGQLQPSSAILVDSDSKVNTLKVDDIVIDQQGIYVPSGNLTLGFTSNNIDVSSIKIINVGTPTDSADAATKDYVDTRVTTVSELDLVTDSGSVYSLTLSDSDLTILGNNPIKTHIDRHQIYISLDSSGVTAGSYGSATQIPVFSVDSHGLIDSATTVAIASVASTSYDSATGIFTINTSDGSSFSTTIHDSDDRISEIRNAINASGDLSYDASTGIFSFDVEQVYTKTNFDSDFNTAIDEAALNGTGLSYDSALNTLSITNTGVVSGNYGSATQVPVISVNAQGQIDSIGEVIVAGVTSTSYDSTSGVYTINTADGGSFATRFHDSDDRISEIRGAVSAAGDLSYDPNTGIFQFDVEQVYTKANFDSDFNLAIDEAVLNGTGLSYDSASNTLSITDTGVIAATYGSATQVPVFTVNAQGQIDSAGEVTVAGVSSTAYDSDTGVFTINTADGNSFATRLHDSGDRISEIRTAIQAADAGGDGSFAYDNSTGVFTYTGPSATEVRAHAVAGTGVGYDSASGVISIGQPVEITSAVTFAETTVDSSTSGQLTLTSRLSNQVTRRAGTIYHDSDVLYGLSYIPTTTEGATDATISLGRQSVIYAHNQTGGTISRGDVVYISGTAHGEHPKVSLARANAASTSRAVGIATTDIVNNAHGFVTRFGLVDSINTGGFVAGSDVYLSADSDGKFTTTEVTIDNGYPIRIGKVVKADAAAGSILVDPFSEHSEYFRIQEDLKVDGHTELDSADITLLNFNTTTFTDVSVPDNLPSFEEGNLFYFQGPDALAYSNSNINVKIGQDDVTRVYNNSGSDIGKGKAVYVTGAANDFPTIALAQSNNFNTLYNTIGLTSHAITNGTFGFVTTRGLYGGLNTQGFSVGDRVHVSPDSGGELVDFNPTFPNYSFEVGIVLIADSAGGGNVGGCIQVIPRSETFETFRVQSNGRVDGNLTVSGNLNILGTETKTSVATLAVGDQYISVQEGDTLTTVQATGSGLNDATFKDHYQGNDTQTYFVEIFDADSALVGDTLRWGLDSANGGPDIGSFTYLGFDSAAGSVDWNLLTDGKENIPLRFNITIDFVASTGHDSGDVWSGAASPSDEDFGFYGNYNAGSQYSLAGFFRDASDNKFKFFNRYDSSDIVGNIDVASNNYTTATLVADLEGNVTGDVTGNADTATLLETSRNFGMNGDITSDSVGFSGGANVTLTTTINDGAITNAKINSAAAIVDTKLDTISTVGKVQNSATTATSANTGSSIVARDASGNFSAGTITASLTGQVSDISNHSTTNLSEGDNLYYTTARHDSDTLAQVDSAYVQSRVTLRDSSFVTGIVDASYIQSNQIQYNTSNFTDSAFVTGLPVSTFDNDRKYFDSNSATAFIDASYVQARQIQYNTSNFTDSSFVTGLPVSTFDNDRKYLDSSAAQTLIDASYIQTNQIQYNTSNFTDSAFVTGLPISTFDNDRKYFDSNSATTFIDASYVQARQIQYNTSNFTDSAFVTGLPVSTFDNDRKYLDSSSATTLIDSVYIQGRQVTYNTSDFTDSAFVTGLPVSTFTNDANYLDSALVSNLIDSDYVAARQVGGGSAGAVLVSATDTTAAKLATKLVEGTEIKLDIVNPGGNETLKVSAPNMVAYAIALGG